MSRNRIFRLATAMSLLALVLSSGTPAFANPPRVTRGDAEAVFNAFATGGQAIRLHRGILQGGPSDRLGSSISPFPIYARHYCEDDWHALMLALFDGGDRTFSYQDAVASLSPTSMEFTLDGAPLDTERHSIRRTLNPERFGFEEAYGYTQGRVMSPEELPAGEHTLRVVIYEDGVITGDLSVTFIMDASGTGVCVE